MSSAAPKHNLKIVSVCVGMVAALFFGRCCADYVLYTLPGTNQVTVFEGKAKILSGGNVEYTHAAFGSITLSLNDVVVIKAPSRNDEFRKLRNLAAKSKSAIDHIAAAREALKQGLLKEFYECCSDAYRIEPDDKIVQCLVEARKRIKRVVSGSKEVESELRDTTNLVRMNVAVSAHYVMLHDTSDVRVGRKRQTRAETRLQLLETIFESYFMMFALEGHVLEPPKKHLMVLLFSDEITFQRYSTLLDPRLAYAGGFWSAKDNISVFYDQGTTPVLRRMSDAVADLRRLKLQTRGTPVSQEVAHLANAVDLMNKIAREQADIEVVSHEATHQLAGNTGIMPTGKIGARWAHEGLASYFETPSGAAWGGVGAVNQNRLADHRKIAADPNRRSLEQIVSDELFYSASGQREAIEAYGQAWALTYYLMETHREKLMEYYKRCSTLEDDATKQTRIDAFEDVFGDLRPIEQGFYGFSRLLKTDLERIRDLR